MNKMRLEKIEKRVQQRNEPIRVILVYEGDDPGELVRRWYKEHPDAVDDDAPLVLINKPFRRH